MGLTDPSVIAAGAERHASLRVGILQSANPASRRRRGGRRTMCCVLPVQFILGGVAGGSFGEGTLDIQAQKMDWCSIGPRGLTQRRCIAPATCSHTRSYSPPIHSSAGKPGTLDRRSAPASGLRPRSFQYLTSSKPVGASKPPAGAQALAKNSPREPSKRSKGAVQGFQGASGRCLLKSGAVG